MFKGSVAAMSLAAALITGASGTQNAIANGDTRSITIRHMHTKEETTVTFRRDGRYDGSALEKLNWALRDWRSDEPIKMDPRLFDVAWEVHRSVGSDEPFHVVSAYRSPGTNSMLRRRSRGVAKHSQHMLGKAMDFYLPDISPTQIRAVGMQLQRGGVGYYPTANTPFIHLDVGSVRSWPRMSRDQLARIFPTGKTVHLPADGEPLAGYETAKAEILARGGSVAGYAAADLDEGAIIASGSRSNFWTALFGGGSDEDEAKPARGRRGAVATRQTAPSTTLAYANTTADNDPMGRFSVAQAPQSQAQAVPLRERLAASSRKRNAAPEQAPEAETRVAALAAPTAAQQAAQKAALAKIDAKIDAEVETPAKPALAQIATPALAAAALVNAPMPLTRPRNILMPAATPDTVQLAALAPDAAAQTDLNTRLVPAPAPPLRPSAMASVVPAPTAEPPVSQAAVSDQGAAEPVPQGRLVTLAHPLPPARPATVAPHLIALAPAGAAAAPVAAGIVSNTERDALNQLFSRAMPLKTPAKPKVTTARALSLTPKDGMVSAEDSPAASVGFIKTNPNDVRTDKFTGPAVRPLPTSFTQQ